MTHNTEAARLREAIRGDGFEDGGFEFIWMGQTKYTAEQVRHALQSQPSEANAELVNQMASTLRNTEVGHPFPDGTRQTLADALCDGLNCDPTDDSAADVY